MERKQVALSIIKIDAGTQSRTEIIQKLVDQYAEDMEAGAVFPAIRIYTDGVYHYLADGFHRYFAHLKNGKTSIEADIVKGTLREAIWYSLSANNLHGERPTIADRIKSLMIILEDFEWQMYSDAEIGRHCGLSPKTVAKYRTNAPQVRKYITKNGNVAEKRAANQKAEKVEPKAKAVAPVEPVAEEDAHLNDMVQDLVKDNQNLTDRLAVAALDATDDEKAAAKSLIEELREEIRQLNIELTAVKISRDSYQRDNAQLKKQCAMYQKQLKKA